MNILEEFWYGNIEPAEYDTSSSKEYKELLQLISRNPVHQELFQHYSAQRGAGGGKIQEAPDNHQPAAEEDIQGDSLSI